MASNKPSAGNRITHAHRRSLPIEKEPQAHQTSFFPFLVVCFIIVLILQGSNLAYQSGWFGGAPLLIKQVISTTFKPSDVLRQNPAKPLTPIIANVPENPSNLLFGPSNAPLVITVFTDPACVPCRRQLDSYLLNTPTAQMRFVYKYWPQNPADFSSGILQEMARRKGKEIAFWNLLSRQTTTPSTSALLTFMESLGFTLLEQRAILSDQSNDIFAALKEDTAQAEALKLGPPPQIILNGYLLDGKILQPTRLATYIQRLQAGESLIQTNDVWLNP